MQPTPPTLPPWEKRPETNGASAPADEAGAIPLEPHPIPPGDALLRRELEKFAEQWEKNAAGFRELANRPTMSTRGAIECDSGAGLLEQVVAGLRKLLSETEGAPEG